jgi:hypothetical protein
MKTIIAFIKYVLAFRAPKSVASTEDLVFLMLKAELSSNAAGAFGDGIFHSEVYYAKNLKELGKGLQKYFKRYAQWGVITSKLISEYPNFFHSNHIYANQMAPQGYLLVDGDNYGTAYGNTLAVAIEHGKVYGCGNSMSYGFDYSELEIQDSTAYGESNDNCCLSLFASAKGKAYGHSHAYTWDYSHVDAYNQTKVAPTKNSTYNLLEHSSLLDIVEE